MGFGIWSPTDPRLYHNNLVRTIHICVTFCVTLCSNNCKIKLTLHTLYFLSTTRNYRNYINSKTDLVIYPNNISWAFYLFTCSIACLVVYILITCVDDVLCSLFRSENVADVAKVGPMANFGYIELKCVYQITKYHHN